MIFFSFLSWLHTFSHCNKISLRISYLIRSCLFFFALSIELRWKRGAPLCCRYMLRGNICMHLSTTHFDPFIDIWIFPEKYYLNLKLKQKSLLFFSSHMKTHTNNLRNQISNHLLLICMKLQHGYVMVLISPILILIHSSIQTSSTILLSNGLADY